MEKTKKKNRKVNLLVLTLIFGIFMFGVVSAELDYSSGASVYGTLADGTPEWNVTDVTYGGIDFTFGTLGTSVGYIRPIINAGSFATTLLFGTYGNADTLALSGGNVGIGTTAPQNKLDVAGGQVIGSTYSGTNTAPTDGLLVEGNVGIGTTSPEYLLDIEASGAAGGLKIGSWSPSIKLTDTNNANQSWDLFNVGSGGYLSFRSYNDAFDDFNDRLAINHDSGNIGIGTTAPTAKLDVNGSINVTGDIKPTTTDTRSLGSLALRWLKGWFVDLDVSGNTTVNNLNVTGNFTLTDTVWEDLRFPANVFKTAGASNLPVFDATDWGLDFEKDDQAFIFAQMPHARKYGTDVHLHIHWSPTSTNVGDVIWGVEYTWANIGDTFPAKTTQYTNSTATGTINDHISVNVIDLNGTGMEGSSIIKARVFRNTTSDTYADDALLLAFDIHYEANKLGSAGEDILNNRDY